MKANDPDPKRRMMEIPRPLPEFRQQWERYTHSRARPSCATGSSSGGKGQRRARSGTQRSPDMESNPKRAKQTLAVPERKWVEDITLREDPDTAFMSMGNTPFKQCPFLCPDCLDQESSSYCI